MSSTMAEILGSTFAGGGAAEVEASVAAVAIHLDRETSVGLLQTYTSRVSTRQAMEWET
jgi:hypothetical protein